MISPGHFPSDRSHNRSSAGSAAARGGVLIVFAAAIGFLLLWRGGVGDDGPPLVAVATDTDTSPSVTTTTTIPPTSTAPDQVVPGTGEVTDPTVAPTTVATPTTRPPNEVKVVVANGVGEAGLAGGRSGHLTTAGYVTKAANAKSTTALSTVFYLSGYEHDALGVASHLGGDAATLRPAPADPLGLLADDTTDVADFHIFVVLGSDRILG